MCASASANMVMHIGSICSLRISQMDCCKLLAACGGDPQTFAPAGEQRSGASACVCMQA